MWMWVLIGCAIVAVIIIIVVAMRSKKTTVETEVVTNPSDGTWIIGAFSTSEPIVLANGSVVGYGMTTIYPGTAAGTYIVSFSSRKTSTDQWSYPTSWILVVSSTSDTTVTGRRIIGGKDTDAVTITSIDGGISIADGVNTVVYHK